MGAIEETATVHETTVGVANAPVLQRRVEACARTLKLPALKSRTGGLFSMLGTPPFGASRSRSIFYSAAFALIALGIPCSLQSAAHPPSALRGTRKANSLVLSRLLKR